MRKIAAFAIASAALVSPLTVSTMAAAQPASPSVVAMPIRGQCYNYTYKQMSKVATPVSAVSCNKPHTAEVFKVVNWYPTSSPFRMSDREIWNEANQLCRISNNSAFTSGKFNYWAFFIPTKGQWREGARWIRCDALIKISDSPATFAIFRGAIL